LRARERRAQHRRRAVDKKHELDGERRRLKAREKRRHERRTAAVGAALDGDERLARLGEVQRERDVERRILIGAHLHSGARASERHFERRAVRHTLDALDRRRHLDTEVELERHQTAASSRWPDLTRQQWRQRHRHARQTPWAQRSAPRRHAQRAH
jgi:hypothetical protein